MDDIKSKAYQQLCLWSDYSYEELVKTRDALGNDELAVLFDKRLADSDDAMRAFNGVEKLILDFDITIVYALESGVVLAKQILYSYRLLLQEAWKKIDESFKESGLKNDGTIIEKYNALEELLDGYLSSFDIR